MLRRQFTRGSDHLRHIGALHIIHDQVEQAAWPLDQIDRWLNQTGQHGRLPNIEGKESFACQSAEVGPLAIVCGCAVLKVPGIRPLRVLFQEFPRAGDLLEILESLVTLGRARKDGERFTR